MLSGAGNALIAKAAVLSDFDVVVIAGDHLDVASSVDGGVQIVVILKYLKRLMGCTRILVSSGNHDLDARDDSGEKVARWMNKVRQMGIPTDGDTVMLGSTLVTICPWWDGPNAKRAVHAQIEGDATKPRKSWVWVYHAPPSGSPTCWDGKQFYGDTELVSWIETYKPDIVFAGHIHQAPFMPGGSWAVRIGPTWVFRCSTVASRSDQRRPTSSSILKRARLHGSRWPAPKRRSSTCRCVARCRR